MAIQYQVLHSTYRLLAAAAGNVDTGTVPHYVFEGRGGVKPWAARSRTVDRP